MNSCDVISPRLLGKLVCPYEREPLAQDGFYLICSHGHRFPVIQNTPVIIRSDVSETIWLMEASRLAAESAARTNSDEAFFPETLGISDDEISQVKAELKNRKTEIDPVISYLVGATNGIMYKNLIGKLENYPIPDFQSEDGQGKHLLDIGCSWGRWSMAAAKKGYIVTGIDPSLSAVLAAKRLARRLGVEFDAVVGDARHLPFRNHAFDAVFSYSVLQHFSKKDLVKTLNEVARAMRADGALSIQMANALGIRSLQHQASRRFRKANEFEVRYYNPFKLRKIFQSNFENTEFFTDCYFGLGINKSDYDIITGYRKIVLIASIAAKRIEKYFPPLRYFADSVHMRSNW